jgi:hypothetical protein
MEVSIMKRSKTEFVQQLSFYTLFYKLSLKGVLDMKSNHFIVGTLYEGVPKSIQAESITK